MILDEENIGRRLNERWPDRDCEPQPKGRVLTTGSPIGSGTKFKYMNLAAPNLTGMSGFRAREQVEWC